MKFNPQKDTKGKRNGEFMMRPTKKQYEASKWKQITLIMIVIPTIFVMYTFLFISWQDLRDIPTVQKVQSVAQEVTKTVEHVFGFDLEIPVKYIPVYMEAAQAYDIPWTLLAAHHRVETRFSTMKSDVSSAGAEGPFQFMPCTFVGWEHPTCSDKGKGDIPQAEKISVTTITQYGGYGIDGDGDGVADPFNIVDATYSAANFLSRYGAADGDLERAIYQYNHSNAYVSNILYYFELYEANRKKLEQQVQ